MKITVSEEQKESFMIKYKKDFETALRSKGEIKSYYKGICTGIEFVLGKLGVITDEEIAKIQTEVSEELEDERNEERIYEERFY